MRQIYHAKAFAFVILIAIIIAIVKAIFKRVLNSDYVIASAILCDWLKNLLLVFQAMRSKM